MALSDELEALAKRHGADTQNPAFGFSVAGLGSLLAEVRKQDDALILQLVEALTACRANGAMGGFEFDMATRAIKSGRARLGGKP